MPNNYGYTSDIETEDFDFGLPEANLEDMINTYLYTDAGNAWYNTNTLHAEGERAYVGDWEHGEYWNNQREVYEWHLNEGTKNALNEFLMQVDPYNSRKEQSAETSAVRSIKGDIRDIVDSHVKHRAGGIKLGTEIGKMNLMGSSSMADMYKGAVKATASDVRKSLSAIEKTRLGLEMEVFDLRDDYIDEMWGLYSDFVGTSPERIDKTYGGLEIRGCMDPEASNYDPRATVSWTCRYYDGDEG